MDLHANWDHGRARYRLGSIEAGAETSVYDEEQLLIAATLVSAEFQVSRAFYLGAAEIRLFEAWIAANTQIAGWRQGRRLGVISSLAPAAK